MKIVHVTYTYAPDPVGGTEVYVAGLVQALRAHAVEGVIAAPGNARAAYAVDGIGVRRFRVSGKLSLEELYGEGDAAVGSEFGAILDDIRPDLVHFHAFTNATSLRASRETQRRRLPIVYTYHTPTVTCQRGTLLQFGTEVCDGVVDPQRCTACTLQGHGVPRALARAISRLPGRLTGPLSSGSFSGGVWTALRMRKLTELRHRAVGAFFDACDRIVVPARWVMDVLIRNRVDERKLVFCRQGVGAYESAPRVSGERTGPLRIAWLGRLDPTKGLHVLVDALQQNPDLDLTLDAYTVTAVSEKDRYCVELKSRIARDSRIRLLPPLAQEKVVATLANYDVLAVPSQGLETGPLVVLEAFAAGIPVVGSTLGGISELVNNGTTGILLTPAAPAVWAYALAQLTANRGALSRMAANIRKPRSMDDVAADMNALYSTVLA